MFPRGQHGLEVDVGHRGVLLLSGHRARRGLLLKSRGGKEGERMQGHCKTRRKVKQNQALLMEYF